MYHHWVESSCSNWGSKSWRKKKYNTGLLGCNIAISNGHKILETTRINHVPISQTQTLELFQWESTLQMLKQISKSLLQRNRHNWPKREGASIAVCKDTWHVTVWKTQIETLIQMCVRPPQKIAPLKAHPIPLPLTLLPCPQRSPKHNKFMP